MLDVLVAARPSHLLQPREVGGSSFLHLVMFGVCVAATRVTVPVVTRPVEDTTVPVPRITHPEVNRLIAWPGLGDGSGAGVQIISSLMAPDR